VQQDINCDNRGDDEEEDNAGDPADDLLPSAMSAWSWLLELAWLLRRFVVIRR
jgi:hypothetical protein